jgi:hypothetical protein
MRNRLFVSCFWIIVLLAVPGSAIAGPVGGTVFCEFTPMCPSGDWYDIVGTDGLTGRLGTTVIEPSSNVFSLDGNWDVSLVDEYLSQQPGGANPYTCTCFHLTLEWAAQDLFFSGFVQGWMLDYLNVNGGPDSLLTLSRSNFRFDIWDTSPLNQGTVISGGSVSQIQSITYVPEPATWTLTLLGAGIVAMRNRSSRRHHT